MQSDRESTLVWTNSTHQPGIKLNIGRTTVFYYVFTNGNLVTACSFDVSVIGKTNSLANHFAKIKNKRNYG